MTGFESDDPVVPAENQDGTLSYTEFDVTFTGISGATVAAPMVVTNCVDGYGIAIGTTNYSSAGTAATAEVPTGSTDAQVKVLKQSGNEFQVNPPYTTSIFTANQSPLTADEPSVAMDASGEFVIAWPGRVSQELAPKDTTDIYLRMYAPVGITGSYSGTAVTGAVTSDLYQQQQLTFDFTSGTVSAGTFELQVGGVVTAPITFSATPAVTATNIQTALLDAGFTGVAVTGTGSGVVFNFVVTFGQSGETQPIQYVASASTLPATLTFSATPTLAFTGVRLLPNPNPQLEPFDITDPYTIQVDVNYTNPQYEPAVAMDPYGNFVVVWANKGPDVSYFNDITMQRFDKQGDTVGNEIEVNNETTNIEFAPDVAMGNDDKVVVAWSDTQIRPTWSTRTWSARFTCAASAPRRLPCGTK